MERFPFTDDLLSGMDDIDAQHRMLFDLANQVVDPTSQRGADASFFASLAFLSEYVDFHFAAEELAMEQAAYPQRATHCRLHREFRAMIGGFVEASLEVSSITELRVQLTEVVSGWLTQHIRVADRALATYLRSHAGSETPVLPGVGKLVDAGYLDHAIDLGRAEFKSAVEPDR